MVGNADDALVALGSYSRNTGGFYLGEGCSRTTFLIGGVVYKIHNGGHSDNVHEFERANLYRPLMPKGFAIPQMSLFSVNGADILACEFIDGILTGECSDEWAGLPCSDGGICLNPDMMHPINEIMGFYDWSYGNVIDCEGMMFLVDCA